MESDMLNKLNERLDLIEFRQELLFNNREIDRLIFQYNVTRDQYNRIIYLMDNYRKMIDNKEQVSHGSFEEEIYKIVPRHDGEYHFCESIARAFAEADRWIEVFDKLYGAINRYKFIRD
jgi:hypothetical protein